MILKAAYAADVRNLDDKRVAVQGYDVVSYFKSNTALKGDKMFSAQVDGATYYFSSADTKAEFLKNPKKYEPQFGGWCAYAVADYKSKVEIDPKSFLIQDGRLLLFYNGTFGPNTRKKWLNTKNKTPEQFLKDADVNWVETQNK